VSLTISTIINGTLSLIRSYNPVTITFTGAVKATAALADAIDGNSATAWAISNAGTISSTSAYGVNLAGQNSMSAIPARFPGQVGSISASTAQ
jgi:hypothetical protein